MSAVVLLLLAPALAALAALLVRDGRRRPLLLPALGVVHLGATLAAVAGRAAGPGQDGALAGSLWLRLDSLGAVVLLGLSAVFLLVACAAPGYLRVRAERPNRALVACAAAFLGLATLAVLSQHLGLMWAAVEGATLACAPMIYFSRHQRSLEATWKYLMVGGVGLALALLGTFFLAYAAIAAGGEAGMTRDALLAGGPLSGPWLRVALALLLAGYGAKMGLAPMHTWKPDAYGEAPGLVGALLAGGMTGVAFLAVARVASLADALGQGDFARRALLALGLLSMCWAAVFMVRQRDIKRLLAYASVEHMGILAVGLALGPAALPAALLHLLGNALAKGALFVSAGNIHRAYASKHVPEVGGVLQRLPVSGAVFLVAFLAATGAPPFSIFLSELGLLRSALAGGSWWTAGLFLGSLALVFLGFSATVLDAVLGDSDAPEPEPRFRDTWRTTAAPAAGLALVLALGLWTPEPLRRLFAEAAAAWVVLAPGGGP